MTRSEQRRFWPKVTKSADACWLWIGCKQGDGYGSFRYKGHMVLAHRLSWQEANGPIPQDMHVLHKCDVRNCVRPDHLFLGTELDNSRDKIAKGRGRWLRGEENPRAKLSTDDVANIRERRASGESMGHLSRDFGVTHTAIRYAVTGRNWKTVQVMENA